MTVKEAMTKVLDDAAAFPAGWNTDLKEVFRREGKDLYERRQKLIWELAIKTPYNGEDTTTVLCRSSQKAKELMEEDIRETLAAGTTGFGEGDLVREGDRNVRLGNAVEWTITRKELVA